MHGYCTYQTLRFPTLRHQKPTYNTKYVFLDIGMAIYCSRLLGFHIHTSIEVLHIYINGHWSRFLSLCIHVNLANLANLHIGFHKGFYIVYILVLQDKIVLQLTHHFAQCKHDQTTPREPSIWQVDDPWTQYPRDSLVIKVSVTTLGIIIINQHNIMPSSSSSSTTSLSYLLSLSSPLSQH